MAVDPEVLVRLLLAQRAMLLGYISSFVRDSHLAEDLFQDISLIILRKGAELAEPGAFAPWARRITRLEVLNALRRREKAPRSLDVAVLDLLDRHWGPGDRESSPAAESLRPCLERLSPRAREIVDLRYRDGLSGKALAARLAQPLNTVYVALARIHRSLSDCLQGASRA